MCRAREELSRIFSKVIRARRASGAREDDILQCFIDSRYEKARHPFELLRLSVTAPSGLSLACRVVPRLSVYGKVVMNLLALVHGACVAQVASSTSSLPAMRSAGLLLQFAWHHLVVGTGADAPPSVHARSATRVFLCTGVRREGADGRRDHGPAHRNALCWAAHLVHHLRLDWLFYDRQSSAPAFDLCPPAQVYVCLINFVTSTYPCGMGVCPQH